MLDRDLLRPGRFDRVIQVSLPDATAREAILLTLLSRLPLCLDSLDAVLLHRTLPRHLQATPTPLQQSSVSLQQSSISPQKSSIPPQKSPVSPQHGLGLDSVLPVEAGGERQGGGMACEGEGGEVRRLAQELAKVTAQCSGADLRHLCRLAALDAVQRDPACQLLVPSDFFDVIGKVCKGVINLGEGGAATTLVEPSAPSPQKIATLKSNPFAHFDLV